MVTQQPPSPLVVLVMPKRLVAMNAHTGQRVWEFETGYVASHARVFVDQGRVFFASSTTLLCLDYPTGALCWKASIPRMISVDGSINMLVFAGCVLFTGSGEAACFAVHNGAQLWHDPFKGYGAGGGAMAAPGVASQVHRSS